MSKYEMPVSQFVTIFECFQKWTMQSGEVSICHHRQKGTDRQADIRKQQNTPLTVRHRQFAKTQTDRNKQDTRLSVRHIQTDKQTEGNSITRLPFSSQESRASRPECPGGERKVKGVQLQAVRGRSRDGSVFGCQWWLCSCECRGQLAVHLKDLTVFILFLTGNSHSVVKEVRTILSVHGAHQ